MFSTLSASYASAGTASRSRTAYVAVDPKVYEGTWSGKYSTNETFKFTISNVSGFRAKVKYQSGSTVKYQDVLIKDNSFKIDSSKFTVTKIGTAQIKTIATDPVTGGTVLNTAYAKKGT
jgi:hypothetical protein